MDAERILHLVIAAMLAFAPLSFGGAAVAQPAAPAGRTAATATVGEVVVTARRSAAAAKAFSRAVSGFVTAQSQPNPTGLLSRWMSPICPTVVGLTPGSADFVSRRITEVAARVGAPRGRCGRSNVRVVFTAEPQKLMDYVRDKFPDLLGYHFAPQEKALAAFQEPIDAWHATGTRDEHGAGFADDPYNQKDPQVASGAYYALSGASGSRLKGAASSEFLFALVVIDSRRAGTQPIGRIADQVAMLVLTNPKRPKACSPLPTLLDSLDPACPASASLIAFTPYDEAFLKGLYSSNPEEKAALERGEVARRIEAAGRAEPGRPQ